MGWTSKQKEGWNIIANHPQTALVVAMLALALGLSPRVNSVAAWMCVILAVLIAVLGTIGSEKIKSSAHPKAYKATCIVLILISFGCYGWWITDQKDNTPEISFIGLNGHGPRSVGDVAFVDFRIKNNTSSVIPLELTSLYVVKPVFLHDVKLQSQIENQLWMMERSSPRVVQAELTTVEGQFLQVGEVPVTESDFAAISESKAASYFLVTAKERESHKVLFEGCVYTTGQPSEYQRFIECFPAPKPQ